VAAAERRYAELDRQHTEAIARASKVEEERDALAAALDAERQQAAAAQAAAETRVASIDAERLNAERSRLEAEARVEEQASERGGLAAQRSELIAERDELIAERDDLIARLEAAERMSQDMRTAVEGRLSTIDDVHKRAVRAKEQAEARADAAIRERDALASELAAVRQSASPDGDPEIAARLEAATERIRVLELELFQRDRGPRDKDVDLVPLLDTTASPPSPQAGKSAKRYAFPAATNIRIDREGGLLADLSVTGAQVIVKTSPEVGRVVTLALLSDEAPCFCQGQLMWARREQTAKGRPYRYRVGLMFTSADESAIEAFIKAHAVG
jgi:small-conductance mechanosensitive channel